MFLKQGRKSRNTVRVDRETKKRMSEKKNDNLHELPGKEIVRFGTNRPTPGYPPTPVQ